MSAYILCFLTDLVPRTYLVPGNIPLPSWKRRTMLLSLIRLLQASLSPGNRCEFKNWKKLTVAFVWVADYFIRECLLRVNTSQLLNMALLCFLINVTKACLREMIHFYNQWKKLVLFLKHDLKPKNAMLVWV